MQNKQTHVNFGLFLKGYLDVFLSNASSHNKVRNTDFTRHSLNDNLLCVIFPLSLSSAEMSGTGQDISQVHWKQQWLENGTLYFHVSMTESELLAQTTQPTAREPAHALHEHMHLLHISVMVSYEDLSL